MQYPLNRTQKPTAIVGADNAPTIVPIWSTTDNEEKVTITLTVSLNEFIVLSSAVDVGSDIAYGDDSVAVWWLWTRSLNTMPLCDQIADCITNTQQGSPLDTALRRYSQNTEQVPRVGESGQDGVYPPLSGEILVNECNLDTLFALVTQVVDYANIAIEDMLESLEGATGRVERIGAIIEAIPLVGLLPIDDVFQFVDQMIDNFRDNYTSQYNQTLRNEYRCDLFCIAQANDCILDIQDIAEYFLSRVSATFDPVTVAEAFDWFVFGTFSGNLIVHGMHALLFQVLSFGSTFLSVDVALYQRLLRSFSNDSDSDWQTLCDECPEPSPCELPISIDFESSLTCAVIINGVIATDKGVNGVGDACLYNEETKVGRTSAEIKITINNATGSVTVTAWHRNQVAGAIDKGRQEHRYYDENDVLLQSSLWNNVTNTSWIQRTSTYSGTTPCSYVVLWSTQSDTIDTTRIMRIDDIQIT